MAFRVAMLQIEPFGIDQSRNLGKGMERCREAKSLGADLVVFPELWNVGCTRCPMDAIGRQAWAASAIDRRSRFFVKFAALAKELGINIAVTYLEAHLPKPRNSVSIIDCKRDIALNYSKVFICDFGQEELRKPDPNPQEIGCEAHCSPGDSFDVCVLTGAQDQVKVGAMICADREFPEPATQLMLNGAELIVVPNACSWDEIRKVPDSRREPSTTWLASRWRIIPAPMLGIPKHSRVLLGVMASLRTRFLEGLACKKKYFSSVLTFRRFENSEPRSPGGWTIAVMGHNGAFPYSRSLTEIRAVG